jgi:uncharacterized phiE125 gp8 family phage protein
MGLQLLTPPAQEPISIGEAKEHLRVTQDTENTLIDVMISAARERAELVSRRALVTQTWKYVTDAWPTLPTQALSWQSDQDDFVLPFPPLITVSSVVYYDTAGAPTTLPSSTYIVDTASQPGRISLAYAKAWPSTALQPKNGIAITFDAGYGAAGAVPAMFKVAIKAIVAHWFENREAFLVAPRAAAVEIPMSVREILFGLRP